MDISVIDPGHGGQTAVGKSTPYGSRHIAGGLEKDFNLRVAERVAYHLGEGAVLTRRGDVNLSLADRIAVARRMGARVFVSLHASEGGRAGTEIHVHPRAGAASTELARAMQRSLRQAGGRIGGVEFSEMAVLSPDGHDRRTAACLVEIDPSSHAPGDVDGIGRAIAGAVGDHLRYAARGLSSVEHADEIEELKQQIRAAAAGGQTPAQYRGALTRLRSLLIDAIRAEDLKWFTLDLRMGQPDDVAASYTVQVCSPVLVSGFFVPVTAQETWDLASRFGAMPLSRAVADQQVNEAVRLGNFVEFSPLNIETHGPGFDAFTDVLKATKYMSGFGNAAVSGSHKLWLISSRTTDAKPVNYGFHHRGAQLPGSQGAAGPYLQSSYSVVNGLIRAHDWANHWDYSQLLQLMRDLRANGEPVDLRQALLSQNPAVWDEPSPPERLPAAAASAFAVPAAYRSDRAFDTDPDGDSDAAYSIEGPIPDEAEPPSAPIYGQAQEPQYPGAAQFLPARTGHFRVPATPRTISRVVIHITDGTTLSGATGWFQSAANTARTSAHYVVGQDGTIVQMVRHENIAHHAGAANGDSIGIEHVALSPAGARDLSTRTGRTIRPVYPTEAQYRASAALVAWLCRTLNIPLDRDHIVGHSEAAPTTHTGCPNSVWDWYTYLNYLGIPQPGDYPAPPSDRAYAARY
jgi:N-acetyl-anhydromuramyl-L-alanine amidase AmpD